MSRLGPVDHIVRIPLPWRTDTDLTECGKPLADLPTDRIITVEELQARIRDVGKQRAAFTACMVCMDTSDRHHRATVYSRHAGSTGGVEALAREIEGVRYAFPPTDPISDRSQRAGELWARYRRLDTELDAIAALIAAHRDEFDAYLQDRAQTVSLAARRQQRKVRR